MRSLLIRSIADGSSGALASGPGPGPAEAGRRIESRGESGMHMPFLAPDLCGVRLRPTARGLEFALPNPSGARGVYVASWSVVTGFAAPVPHDTLLVDRLARLDRIGPAEVRNAARMIALEGFAGAGAADAARDAQAALERAAERLRAQLLRSVARLAGVAPGAAANRVLEPAGFAELCGRIHWEPADLLSALRDLSRRCASVLGGTPSVAGTMAATGRWTRMLRLVRRLRDSLAGERGGRGDIDILLLSRLIAAADRCLRVCGPLVDRIADLLADPMAELETCRDRGAAQATPWLDELEVTLDGWDRIGLLWFEAPDARARSELLPEIAALARIGGGDGWAGSSPRPEPIRGVDASGAARPDRMRVRNEHLRLLELAFEADG